MTRSGRKSSMDPHAHQHIDRCACGPLPKNNFCILTISLSTLTVIGKLTQYISTLIRNYCDAERKLGDGDLFASQQLLISVQIYYVHLTATVKAKGNVFQTNRKLHSVL
ncbi:hypothetical protein Mapa_013840 [Marchantia paleacea]|nr:hypothetical protein Mapa_013840 [Marchantia paleacea]